MHPSCASLQLLSIFTTLIVLPINRFFSAAGGCIHLHIVFILLFRSTNHQSLGALAWFHYPHRTVAFSSCVCVCGAVCAPGTAKPPLEQGSCGCSSVTNILAQHYQQQHKHRLATAQLLIGIFVCLCVWSLCMYVYV